MVFITVLGLLVLAGCPEKKPSEPPPKAYFIRVGQTKISLFDFNKIFDLHKSAYEYDELDEKDKLKIVQMEFFNQMVERLILLERARELHIEVSAQELEAAVEKIKKDYPDDEFDKTLLKSAVSYTLWCSELKDRLVMEKVIQKDLTDAIPLTVEEMNEYHEKRFKNKVLAPEQKIVLDQLAAEHLRRAKTEKMYREWLENLEKKYPVDINKTEWEKIFSGYKPDRGIRGSEQA
jgi:hypothetical protein